MRKEAEIRRPYRSCLLVVGSRPGPRVSHGPCSAQVNGTLPFGGDGRQRRDR